MINRDRLAQLRKIEDERFLALHPKSGEMFKAGQKNMPGGVPMSWMAKWPGAYPVFVSEAKGARFIDVVHSFPTRRSSDHRKSVV